MSPSRRLRRTPFSEGVEAAGVKAYTIYNHMLLPTVFHSPEEDCRHLKSAVQVWDVACERQIEIAGPDAARLLQMLTPRDLGRMVPERCLYVPMVDETGGMLNDPVALKLDEDRFWISIADSDLLFWIKAICAALRLDARAGEADVAPLAVQGPKADALMARVFGDAVTSLRFFGVGRFAFGDATMLVARSGYSRQGGFEIYVEGDAPAMPLWHALMEAGADLDVRAGCPSGIERVEGGLLSYGNDMTLANTPHECGLGRFCDTEAALGCIGRDALLRVARDGPVRQIRPVEIAARALPPCDRAWPVLDADGTRVGQVTSAAMSPDFGCGVAIGMIESSHWAADTPLRVDTPDGSREARVRSEFWL